MLILIKACYRHPNRHGAFRGTPLHSTPLSSAQLNGTPKCNAAQLMHFMDRPDWIGLNWLDQVRSEKKAQDYILLHYILF